MWWQLGVPLALIVVVAVVGVLRLRHASRVFDQIVGEFDAVRRDEVGRLRQQRESRAAARPPHHPPQDPRTSDGRR